MKTIAAVIVLLVIFHLLAATSGFVWLSASGRLDRSRLEAVTDVFRLTIAEQALLEAENEAAEKQATEMQRHLIRMEDVADGPQSLEDRLARKLEGDDFALHRLARMQEESSAIQQRVDQDRAYVDAQLKRLTTEQKAFDQIKQQYSDQMQDEDFKRAVKTLEQLKGKQAKVMLQTLLDKGKMPLVVDYLSAMNLRKSAGILKEFRSDQESDQAMKILEALRLRGKKLTNPQLAGAAP